MQYFNTSNVTIQPFLRKLSGYIQDYFNTSNVTIQLILTITFFCPFKISIHLMLLFNMDTILEHYIIHQYFNTSNVTIQPPDYISEKIMKENFNTSNVTIQHFRMELKHLHLSISIHLMLLFNNYRSFVGISQITISIHLMLLFNNLRQTLPVIQTGFQYI